MPGGLKEFLAQIFTWKAYCFLSKKRLCTINHGFEGSFSNFDFGFTPDSTH